MPAYKTALNEQRILFKSKSSHWNAEISLTRRPRLRNHHHRSVRFFQQCEDGVVLRQNAFSHPNPDARFQYLNCGLLRCILVSHLVEQPRYASEHIDVPCRASGFQCFVDDGAQAEKRLLPE
jgi:hypothetical protein